MKIETEEGYRTALAQVEALMDAEPGTPRFELLDVMTDAIAEYEKIHYPMPPSWIDRAAWCGAGIRRDMKRIWSHIVEERDPAGHTPAHLYWMAGELERKALDSETKARCWLGYIQGYLVASGSSTLDREKARNLASREEAITRG